ncbi:MAG: HD domain-containing protein [Nitrospirota bacterium]
MDPVAIIEKYYSPGSPAHHILISHSRIVAEKALKIARRVNHLQPYLQFIQDAAMLHDIGIYLTNEPEIGCYGDREYICHGFLGRELLEKEGFPKHALVCERHVGVGIALRDIEEKSLPLPKRDMSPVSLEEKIICLADKFFSKDPEFLVKEKPLALVRKSVARYGDDKLRRFDEWVKMFGV